MTAIYLLVKTRRYVGRIFEGGGGQQGHGFSDSVAESFHFGPWQLNGFMCGYSPGKEPVTMVIKPCHKPRLGHPAQAWEPGKDLWSQQISDSWEIKQGTQVFLGRSWKD